MDARPAAFRDQLRLRLQPMLHLVAGQGALVFISEVSPPGHLVRCRRESVFVPAQSRRGGPGSGDRVLVLILGKFIMSHNRRLVLSTVRSPWGEHPMNIAQASSPAGSPGVPPGVFTGGGTPPQLAAGTDCATRFMGRGPLNKPKPASPPVYGSIAVLVNRAQFCQPAGKAAEGRRSPRRGRVGLQPASTRSVLECSSPLELGPRKPSVPMSISVGRRKRHAGRGRSPFNGFVPAKTGNSTRPAVKQSSTARCSR